MTGTADTIEIVWTAISLLGLMGHLGVLVEAIGAWLASEQLPGNGVRRAVGRMHLRAAAFGSFIEVTFVLAGTVAMLRPASSDPEVEVLRTISVLAFIAGAIVLALWPWIDLRTRRRVEDIMEERAHEEGRE